MIFNCKSKGIRKSEFVAKTKFFLHLVTDQNRSKNAKYYTLDRRTESKRSRLSGIMKHGYIQTIFIGVSIQTDDQMIYYLFLNTTFAHSSKCIVHGTSPIHCFVHTDEFWGIKYIEMRFCSFL